MINTQSRFFYVIWLFVAVSMLLLISPNKALADNMIILDCRYQICPKVDTLLGEKDEVEGYIGSKSLNVAGESIEMDNPHTKGSIENAVDPSLELAKAIPESELNPPASTDVDPSLSNGEKTKVRIVTDQ